MALMPQPQVIFSGHLAPKPSASDLLQSSSNGIFGVPLRILGREILVPQRRDFAVSSKLRKFRKHEYPWSGDLDPNIKGGVLRHLSPFKPLKEKLKPVALDFEKPLLDLEKKIVDVQRMANETGLDFTDQIMALENKYQQALKNLYTHLTPIQRVNIARHPNRPTFLDHVFNITERFVELHGDRAGYDDPAIVTGIGSINDKTYMFIGHQKGRNTKENIQRNFGMPTPHGYRKAMRMMKYAEHRGFPIVTFIDTPGAFSDLRSEELGQGEAIARNLWVMSGLKVPVICIVIGEGGSGGALAIGAGNKLLMLENAVFYVASPEASAAIVWKTAKAAPKAAARLKITARALCRLRIADAVIPEPLAGAHQDPEWTSQQIKSAILNAMDELEGMDQTEIVKHRQNKFRKIGRVQEGIPLDPKRKAKMKKGTPGGVEVKRRIEESRQMILEAMQPSVKKPQPKLKLSIYQMIKKLRREIDREFFDAVKAVGLEKKLDILRKEVAKAGNSKDPVVRKKIDKLNQELLQNLSAAPNYASLKNKVQQLNKISKAPEKIEGGELTQAIIKSFIEFIDLPVMRQKIKDLKTAIENSGVSEETASLKIEGGKLKQEIIKRFKEFVDQPEMKQKIGELKTEIENLGLSGETRQKLLQLNNGIKHKFFSSLNSLGLVMIPSPALEQEVEIPEAMKSSVGSNGSLKSKDDKFKSDEVKVESQVEVTGN